MRKIALYATSLMIIFIGMSQVACNESSTSAATEQTIVNSDQLASADLKVEGMVCAVGCAKYIEKEVSKMDGVFAVNVDFENGEAHIEFDEGQLSAEEVSSFINDMHDGQYTAEILKDEQMEEEEIESTSKAEEDDLSVKERVTFSFPELITYFMRNL